MLYGSETWGMRREDEAAMNRAEISMLRRMFGAVYMHLSGDSMRKRLGIESVSEVVRSRLRWCGHVMKTNEEWVRQCLVFPVEGVRGRGRPRKTRAENVKEDMRFQEGFRS